MANLIDVAQELEYVPEDQLASMIDDPNSKYPSFMVLSEVKRRTQMRKMYENEMSKMNQPQTTVAEEAVMGLMQGQGAMPMQAGMSSPVNSQGSGLQGMAPPMITAQTGLFTGQNNLDLLNKFISQRQYPTGNSVYPDAGERTKLMFQSLLQRAKLGDAEAIKRLEQVQSTPEFQAFSQEQQATPPDVLAQSFPDYFTIDQGTLRDKQREALAQTGQNIKDTFSPLLQGDFSSPYGVGQTVRASGEQALGMAVAPLTEAYKGVDYLAQKVGPPIQEFTKGLLGLSQTQAQELPQDITDTITPEGISKGLQKAQSMKQNLLSDSQFRMVPTSNISAEDVDKTGLASTNDPTLITSDIQERYQKALEEISGVPTQEFESTFGEPISLRSRDEIRDDVAKRLNLPEVTSMKQSEADRQKDMNVALLTGLGAVIGGAKQTGDIATGIGKLGRDISQMRKDARKEDMLSDRLTRQENLQNINLITGIVNAEQTAERATKQLQMAEKKDFDASQLAQKGLQISQAKLVETGLRLELAERAQAQGIAKFELDQIRALQAQVTNLTSALATDPLIMQGDPMRAAQIRGQIDAINEEVNRRFDVPELKDLEKKLKQAQEKKQ